MPEFPPMQLYITLAIAVSIAAIASAFIRQPIEGSISKKGMVFSLKGLHIFFVTAWLHLCFYLSWQIVSQLPIFDSQLPIFDIANANRAFHLFVLGGIGIVSSILLEKILIRNDVSAP